MHILLIHQAFAALDEAGGTRHYEMAAHLVQRGHRVTVISSPVSYLTGHSRQAHPRWLEQDRPSPGITILRAYTYSALHRSFTHRVLSFLSFMLSSFLIGLKVSQVDLVWGTSPPIFQGFTAWLLARLKRVPFLLEIRDLWPEFAIEVGVLRNPLLIRASLWLERFLYRRADLVVVNSPGFIRHVTRLGARRVELVSNGADPAMFDPALEGTEFRRQYGLEGKFVALYAGAHGLSNDLGVILRSAHQLAGDDSIRFVLIGDGKEKSALVNQAQALNLDNVLFLQSIAKTEMSQALAAANACIAILKPLECYKTTYPNKVFDYMAAGRPVILAIDGVIRQVVEDAGAGLFVPPGDTNALTRAVRCLAENPQTARQMGHSGRACIAQKFNRSLLAEQFSLLVEEIVRQNA